MTSFPLISIITPSLNRATMIESAIQSVLAQNYPNVEHLIMDGGSTDGTLDILKNYPHLRVFSGRDDGMYDALNRGLALVRGEFIGFLNTDDEYLPGAFQNIVSAFIDVDLDATVGTAEMTGMGLQYVLSIDQFDDIFDTLLFGVPIFNSWFFRTGVFQKLGAFDTSFRIAGDREFLVRFALAGLHFHKLKKIIYCYHLHGDSLTLGKNKNQVFSILEEHIKLSNNFDNIISPDDPKREKFRKWLKRDTLEACVQAIKNRNISQFLKYLRLGKQYDEFFAFSFCLRLFARFSHASTN